MVLRASFVEVLALAALGAAVAAHLGSGYALVAGALGVVALAAAAIDRRERRIPNALVLIGGAVVGLAVIVSGSIDERLQASMLGAAIGVVCYAGPLLVLHLASPGALGFGDVKLGVVLGAGLGAGHAVLAPLGLVAACVAALVRRVAVRRLDTAEPFAPAMAAGTLAALLAARAVVDLLGFRWTT